MDQSFIYTSVCLVGKLQGVQMVWQYGWRLFQDQCLKGLYEVWSEELFRNVEQPTEQTYAVKHNPLWQTFLFTLIHLSNQQKQVCTQKKKTF